MKKRRATVDERLASLGAQIIEREDATEYAFRYRIHFDGDLSRLADQVEDVEGAEILSIGNALELIKDLGDADRVAGQYGLRDFMGTHGIGHTRMATESDVDIRSAHPYWAYPFNDISVVHNGQLTNYWAMRREFERKGHRFVSNCDSELIAVYMADSLEQGATLEDSLKQSIEELDGVFTYLVSTKDALGMAKDTMAAKPMVLYESDVLIALASEEVAIRSVFHRTRSTPSTPMRGKCASGGSRLLKKDGLSHEMGMHTEQLLGRSQQRFFDLKDRRGRFTIRTRPKSTSRSARNSTARSLDTQQINLQASRADRARLWHRRHEQSGRQAFDRGRHPAPPQPASSKDRRLFRLRPDRRPEHPHQRPRRLVLRREHARRDGGDRKERGLALRRGAARRRPRLQGSVGARAGIDRRAARSSSAAAPARSAAS